jgi:peptidylprolyl isomerase
MENKVTTAKYIKVLSIMLLVALIACMTMLTACGNGTQIAKSGDTVKVLYVGTLDNGSVFDASELHGNVPLQFAIGSGQYLPKFEQAVINLSVNQSTTTHILPEDGYGPTEITFNLSSTDTPPTVGQQYQVRLDNGKVILAVAANVTNTSATFQNTNKLAGQNLNFKITLVEIVKK